jgi:hypothetical protein
VCVVEFLCSKNSEETEKYRGILIYIPKSKLSSSNVIRDLLCPRYPNSKAGRTMVESPNLCVAGQVPFKSLPQLRTRNIAELVMSFKKKKMSLSFKVFSKSNA